MDITKQNFISVDRKTVRNSYGVFYEVGELVGHQDEEAGNATIQSFTIMEEHGEIRVNTNKGFGFLDFLEKI